MDERKRVSRNIEGSTPPSRDSSLTHAARERVRKAPLLPHRAQTTLSLLSHYRRSDGNEGEEEEGEMVIPLSHLLLPPNPRSSPPPPDPYLRSSPVLKKWRIGASSAAPGVDLKPLETAIAKVVESPFSCIPCGRHINLMLCSYLGIHNPANSLDSSDLFFLS